MFETLQAQPADKILALMQMYKDDPRETKIDLGVGVYKDAAHRSPPPRPRAGPAQSVRRSS